MAENDGGGAVPRSAAPLRPTISLPPRSSFESFLRGGGALDVSPGPMTLVSSFFADDPDTECRSFSQLLAGAMSSPAAARRSGEQTAGRLEERDSGGESGLLRLRQNQPMGLMVALSPFFTVPPGLSPATLLDSPSLFSSGTGHFGMSHQQALAQVTAQAAQSHSQIQIQTEYPSSLTAATAASVAQSTGSAIHTAPLHQIPPLTSDTNNATFESADGSHPDHRYQPTALIVDKPADDGYNWRKYGQKQVKGSEYPRSYYKCTHPKCPVKKKVERSLEGQVTEIIYKGEHNHQRPPSNKRAKEGPSGSNELNGNLDLPANSRAGSQGHTGNFGRSDEIMAASSMSKRDQESSHGTPEQLSVSSDGEEVGDAELRTAEVDDCEPDAKRRNIETRVTESTSSHKTVTEPRIIVQTTSEVDLLDDGYRWRKYGQKVVKGNPHPRSYYKCTSVGCNVRKHVERASTDPRAVITTYEGKHNHEVPAARNSSHNTANSGAAANYVQAKANNTISNSQAFPKRTDFRNYSQQPIAVLQLKEEHEIT